MFGKALQYVWNLVRGITKSNGIGITIPIKWTGYVSEPKIQDVITIERTIFTNESTIGELWIDGEMFCYTLEDTCRHGPKIPGKTAIPMGKYRVKIDHSVKFQKPMPHLLDVPNFEGVRIHSGNSAEDTEGCILVGFKKQENAIYDSKLAYSKLFDILIERTLKGPVWIAVIGGGRETA